MYGGALGRVSMKAPTSEFAATGGFAEARIWLRTLATSSVPSGVPVPLRRASMSESLSFLPGPSLLLDSLISPG